jgi:hypothetical protein
VRADKTASLPAIDLAAPPRNQRATGLRLVLARLDPHHRKATISELKRLARDRRASLILVPDLPDLATASANEAIQIAQVPLQAILGALKR